MRAPFASAVILAIATLLVASRADAQETTHGGVPGDELLAPRAEPEPKEGHFVDPSGRRSWREGNSRWFAATTIDAGYLYLRPRVSGGYGKPFNTWVGLDVNPILVSSGLGGYGGLRLAIPYADLRVGARYFAAFQHSFLLPQRNYNRLDIDDTQNAKAKYLTLEAEAESAIPLGPGNIVILGSLSSVAGVPAGEYVFEETLHIVTAPPLVWRVRGGYALKVGSSGQHSVGLVADVLDIPKREDSLSVRAGPVLKLGLSRHFEIRGSFVMTLVSPDRLGLVGGDFTELGVRYRTATE
jgi:hypothetical protein